MSKMSKKNYKIFSINTYAEANQEFIKNDGEVFNFKDLLKVLETDNGYHFRIHKNTQYIFFGDLDNYNSNIQIFIDILHNFMNDKYNLIFTDDEFKYTKNNKNKNSYHYSIPKWNLTTEKLKEIHTILLKEYSDEFIYKSEKVKKRSIDTSIYSEHWFRCPNQKKGINIDDKSKHKIIKGNMEDFIIDYIPEISKNINNVGILTDLLIRLENEIKIKNEEKIKSIIKLLSPLEIMLLLKHFFEEETRIKIVNCYLSK